MGTCAARRNRRSPDAAGSSENSGSAGGVEALLEWFTERTFARELLPGRRPLGEAIEAVYREIHSGFTYSQGVTSVSTTLPEVLALSHVAGPEDFLVHVAVADTAHLQRLVLDRFTTRREVSEVQTNLLFQHVRKHTVPPAGVGRDPWS